MINQPIYETGGSGKRGQTPHELLRKHIADKNHVVTDEELSQVRVGIDAEDENEVQRAEVEMEGAIKHLQHGHSPNPYDVLGNE